MSHKNVFYEGLVFSIIGLLSLNHKDISMDDCFGVLLTFLPCSFLENHIYLFEAMNMYFTLDFENDLSAQN